MSKSALLLAFVAASCLSPALAMPLGGDRAVSNVDAALEAGARRPGPVIKPGGPQADAVMGPHRPGFGSSAGNSSYVADR